MRKSLALAIFTLTGSVAGETNALDGNDLAALQTAIHGICAQPDQKGSYLKVEGDLNAGAVLKVLGVNGTGKITKDSWDGISQRADQYKTDPRQCAISILPILISSMSKPKD